MNEQILCRYNELIKRNEEFCAKIKVELDDFNQTLDIPFPMFFDDEGRLNNLDHWKDELVQILPQALEMVNDEKRVLDNTHRKLEGIMYMEYNMMDSLSNIDTHISEDYI